MKLKVIYPDRPDRIVLVGPRVQVMFERHYKTGLAKTFGKDGGGQVEHLYWLAWRSLSLTDRDTPDFDDWLGQIEDVDLEQPDDDEEQDPTQTGPGPGPSAV